MNTVESVLEQIRPMIADVLAVEPEDVVPPARFFQDLNGESIDLLDLAFQLKKHYGKDIPLQQLAQNVLPTDEDGRLTPESLDELRRDYPFLLTPDFEADPQLNRITELLTVRAISHFVACFLSDGRAPAGQSSVAPK